MGRHVLHREIDPRAGVGEHLIHGRGRRVAVALPARRAEVGRDRNGVERALHAFENPRGHPIVRRKPAGCPHDALRLSGKHLRPDVHVSLRLAAGDLPVGESCVLRQAGLLRHPLRGFEAPGEVPDLVRPLDVSLAARLEVVPHVGREVPHERVVRHVRHVEPRIGVEVVRQLHHVFDRHAVGHGLARRAAEPRTLADVAGVAAIGPGADVGGVRLLRHHEADHAEWHEPLAEEGMKRREGRPRLPALPGERLPLPVGHPDAEVADRVRRGRLLDPQVDAAIARGHRQIGEVHPRSRPSTRGDACIHAECHAARSLPLRTVGARRIRPAELAEHERAGHLSDRLTGRVGECREAGDVAVRVHGDGVRLTDIPRHLAGGRVDPVGDPAPRGLEDVGERPGRRPVHDALQIHPHPHVARRRRGHHLPGFEWLQTETAPLSGAAFCDARRMVPRAGSK